MAGGNRPDQRRSRFAVTPCRAGAGCQYAGERCPEGAAWQRHANGQCSRQRDGRTGDDARHGQHRQRGGADGGGWFAPTLYRQQRRDP